MLALLLCLWCDTYHLLIMPPILLNQASNPPCPSKHLFGYVTALLSPLIALLVAGEVEDCSMVDMILVGISQYLLYY